MIVIEFPNFFLGTTVNSLKFLQQYECHKCKYYQAQLHWLSIHSSRSPSLLQMWWQKSTHTRSVPKQQTRVDCAFPIGSHLIPVPQAPPPPPPPPPTSGLGLGLIQTSLLCPNSSTVVLSLHHTAVSPNALKPLPHNRFPILPSQ